MLSVFDEGAPAPCPEPFNLAAHVLRHAGTVPDKVALAVLKPSGAERWSYSRLEAAVRGTGAGLLAEGFEPGQRVVLRLGNTADFPVAFLGTVAAGLVPVPLSAALTAPEVASLLEVLDPVAILSDGVLPLPDTTCPVILPDTFRQWREHPPCAYAMGDPERPGYIVFTSGTSGGPRAVVHAHRAIWARHMMRAGWDGIGLEDRVLHAGAFNWTYTLGTGLLDPWSAGATALIPAEGTEASALPLLLKRHDATIFAATPAFYRRLLTQDLPDLPKLRHGLSAGEKLSPTLRAAWQDATGTPILEALGMSECSTFISASVARPAPEGTTGYPQPGRRIAVLGPDGPVPRGAAGELAVHASDPGLFLGYLGAEQETQAKFKGEWFCTGDRVAMRADGAIEYHGRLDEMMNAGGVRVSPLEVEAALHACPGIGDVAVVEAEVKADTTVISAAYTGDAAPADLDRFAKEWLARYKRPRLWHHLPELPRTRTGKIDRRALRALIEKGLPA